jgi:hypothetical protein
MKFITITILFALIACSLAQIPDEDKWCGSSVVSVDIVSTENGKEVVTKATLLVPVSLEKPDNLSIESKGIIDPYKTGTLIKKSQQGIIFTLNGPPDSSQLSKIYEKDEDSETNIYIPYAFITQINSNTSPDINPTNFIIDLYFKKDFQSKVLTDKQIYKVSLRFTADQYRSNICECMFKFFAAKIRFNWRLRRESLEYIRSQLFSQIKSLYANYKAIKTVQASTTDLKLVETLKINMTSQESQCSNLKLTLDMNQNKSIELSTKMDAITDPGCEKFDVQIKDLQIQMDAADAKAKADIASAALNLRLSDSPGLQKATSQVNEQQTFVGNKFKDMEPLLDALDQTVRTTYDVNKNEFTNIKWEVNMEAAAESKYLETAKVSIQKIITYFDGSFWKQ